MSRAAEGEAASLEFFAVAPASVPVLFRGSGRISRAVPRFGLPYLSAKKRNRHGGRRYGQGPGSCVIRQQAIALAAYFRTSWRGIEFCDQWSSLPQSICVESFPGCLPFSSFSLASFGSSLSGIHASIEQ